MSSKKPDAGTGGSIEALRVLAEKMAAEANEREMQAAVYRGLREWAHEEACEAEAKALRKWSGKLVAALLTRRGQQSFPCRAKGMADPPPHIVELAVEVSGWSPCRSKRGVVIFRGENVISHGHNFKPRGFECDASDACKASCRDEAVHAEQIALIAAGGRPTTDGADLLHVKSLDGRLVPSGGPSCVQCSKLIVACGIAGVWLYHETGWTRYESTEFHRQSLEAALLTRRGQPDDDSDVRKGLWLNHGCDYATLYGDDGEMQCHTCHVDFKRDGLPHIARMLFALGRLHAGKLPEPATRRDQPEQFQGEQVIAVSVFREDDGRFAAEYRRDGSKEGGMGEYSATPIGALANLCATLIKVDEDLAKERAATRRDAPQERHEEDLTRVAPLKAGADGQDLPQSDEREK